MCYAVLRRFKVAISWTPTPGPNGQRSLASRSSYSIALAALTRDLTSDFFQHDWAKRRREKRQEVQEPKILGFQVLQCAEYSGRPTSGAQKSNPSFRQIQTQNGHNGVPRFFTTTPYQNTTISTVQPDSRRAGSGRKTSGPSTTAFAAAHALRV